MSTNSTRSFSDNIYLPNSMAFVSCIVIVALSPVAVLGNSLILATIWKKKFERTSFHILLSALALTDLLTGLVSQPFLSVLQLLVFVKPGAFVDRVVVHTKLLAIGACSGFYFSGSTICILTFMSVERWLHMTRRSLMTTRCRRIAITVLLLSQIPVAALAVVEILKEKTGDKLFITFGILMFLCYLITSFAYFKVFQVIRQHQQQVQGNQSGQNVAQPATNLAKYKRTMVTIFYILTLFSISILPLVVWLIVFIYKGGFDSETLGAFYMCLIFLFSFSSLNPILYLWRMNDIRNGVKQLFYSSG